MPSSSSSLPFDPVLMAAKPKLFLALAVLAIFATNVLAARMVLGHATPSNTTSSPSNETGNPSEALPPGGPNPKIGQSAQFDICQPNPADCQAPPAGTKLRPGVSPVPDVGPENLCWYKGVWYLSNNNRGSRQWWYYFAEELNQYCCPRSCEHGEPKAPPNGVTIKWGTPSTPASGVTPFGKVCQSFWSKDECRPGS